MALVPTTLTDAALVLLYFQSHQDAVYGDTDEVDLPGSATYEDVSQAEVVRRFGEDGVESLSAWTMGSHASLEDLIRETRNNPTFVLSLLRLENAR